MRKIFVIGLSLLFASVGIAQEHGERPVPKPSVIPQTQTAGQRYISDAGRYSVRMPSEPKLSSQNTTGPTGEQFTQYIAMAADSTMLFMVGYFDYSSNIVFNLDKARDGMIDSIKGTLLDNQAISLGGKPGQQVRISGTTDEGVDFVERARFYDINPRVYVLQCIVFKSQDSPAAADRCEQFFDSFRVRAAGPG